MKLTILFLLAMGLFMTGCSLPGGNDLTSPDETEKEQRNPRYLEKIYAPIRGEYALQFVQEGTTFARCLALEIDYRVTEDGKNSVGQPILNVSLFAKFTDVDSFINEETLTGRYYPENGTIAFILPAAKQQTGVAPSASDKVLQITGQILNGKLTGELQIQGYASGNLRGKLASETTCPSKADLRQRFSSKVEQMFAGEWNGSTETTANIAGFNTRLQINVQRIPTSGGFTFDILSNFEREPYGMFKPTPVQLNIFLNQSPVVVNFTSGIDSGYPKFYGTMKDAETIQGVLIYPAASMNAVFKRKK